MNIFRIYYVLVASVAILCIGMELKMFLYKRKIKAHETRTTIVESASGKFNNSAKNANVRIAVVFWVNITTMVCTHAFIYLNQDMQDLHLLKKLMVDYFVVTTEASVVIPVAFFAENPQIFRNLVSNIKNVLY